MQAIIIFVLIVSISAVSVDTATADGGPTSTSEKSMTEITVTSTTEERTEGTTSSSTEDSTAGSTDTTTTEERTEGTTSSSTEDSTAGSTDTTTTEELPASTVSSTSEESTTASTDITASEETTTVTMDMKTTTISRPSKKCEINLQACAVDVKGLISKKDAKGPKGDKGKQGVPGPKGEKGDIGPLGPEGKKGHRGLPGTCKCKCEEDCSDSESSLPKACKYQILYEPTDMKIRKEKEIKVRCKKLNPSDTSYSTCLKAPEPRELSEKNLEDLSYSYNSEDSPFWYSDKAKERFTDKDLEDAGFAIGDFYFGNKREEIKYLLKHSGFVTMKIKYHCKNSIVVPKDETEETEKALQMLSWNGHVIGPSATSFNPFHYHIDDDGCQDPGEGWNYTEIRMLSLHEELPVLDFYIRDIRDGEHKFYIELVELCFGG